MHRFLKRLEMKDTHFVSVTMNPGSRCRTADVGKIGEKLRLSPYCCCYLPPQREQFPCIIDDSQQNVRECRQVRFAKSQRSFRPAAAKPQCVVSQNTSSPGSEMSLDEGCAQKTRARFFLTKRIGSLWDRCGEFVVQECIGCQDVGIQSETASTSPLHV